MPKDHRFVRSSSSVKKILIVQKSKTFLLQLVASLNNKQFFFVEVLDRGK